MGLMGLMGLVGLVGQKPPRGVPHLRIRRGRETLAEREF